MQCHAAETLYMDLEPCLHLQVRWSQYGKYADQMRRQEEEGCSKSVFCRVALTKVVRVEVSLLHSNERSKRSSILHNWLLEPAPALLNLRVFTFHQSKSSKTLDEQYLSKFTQDSGGKLGIHEQPHYVIDQQALARLSAGVGAWSIRLFALIFSCLHTIRA